MKCFGFTQEVELPRQSPEIFRNATLQTTLHEDAYARDPGPVAVVPVGSARYIRDGRVPRAPTAPRDTLKNEEGAPPPAPRFFVLLYSSKRRRPLFLCGQRTPGILGCSPCAARAGKLALHPRGSAFRLTADMCNSHLHNVCATASTNLLYLRGSCARRPRCHTPWLMDNKYPQPNVCWRPQDSPPALRPATTAQTRDVRSPPQNSGCAALARAIAQGRCRSDWRHDGHRRGLLRALAKAAASSTTLISSATATPLSHHLQCDVSDVARQTSGSAKAHGRIDCCLKCGVCTAAI